MLSMLVDHINHLYPENMSETLTIMGRLAFPLFAFVAVHNYTYFTSDKNKYIARLFLWGCISQIPYYLYFNSISLNIILALALGISLIKFIEYIRPKLNATRRNLNLEIFYFTLSLVMMLLIWFESVYIEMQLMDYGIPGLIMLIGIHLFITTKKMHFLIPILFINGLYTPYIYMGILSTTIIILPMLMTSIKTIPIPRLHPKLYYYFYPAHLTILSIIKTLL